MSKMLHLTDFEPLLNKTFQVNSEEVGAVKIKLVEATKRDREGLESFSLVFKGPKEPVLRQMTYTFKQNKLGSYRMFLVPIVSGERDAVMYQSIINRKKEEA